MKKRLPQPDVMTNRLTRVASAIAALLLVSASLILAESEAAAAGDAAVARAYPPVVEPQGAADFVFYLDGPASAARLPNGLPDIALDRPHKKNGVWILPLFFRGKIPVASYNPKSFTVTLHSGAHISLEFEPTDGSWKRDDKTNIYTRADGARFGYEEFNLPDGIEDLEMRCGDVSGGVVRLDATGKPLWRKTYVKLEHNVREDDWGSCGHFPRQPQLLRGGDLIGFGDDTIGVLVGHTVIRVSAETGMPVGPVSDVKVFDSAEVAAARAERYSKVFGGGKLLTFDNEAEYYKLETDYFFPHEE